MEWARILAYITGTVDRQLLLENEYPVALLHRHSLGQVIVQKAPPSRGGTFMAPRKVSPDSALANLDAELEQFAVDARCSPRAGWQGSSGGSGHGFRHSSWVVQNSVIVRQ
jgi:hypothetical protein